MRLPTPVYMADIARAMQTPPPASEQTRTPAGPDPRFTQQPALAPLGAGEKAGITRANNAARDAKNERARLRRKAKRAADAKLAKIAMAKKAAAPKRKKKKAVAVRKARAQADAMVLPVKKRRRGRPPGAKNKPKAIVGGPFLPVAAAPAPRSSLTVLAQINAAVALLNAMPEHARKVVLDAVK